MNKGDVVKLNRKGRNRKTIPHNLAVVYSQVGDRDTYRVRYKGKDTDKWYAAQVRSEYLTKIGEIDESQIPILQKENNKRMFEKIQKMEEEMTLI